MKVTKISAQVKNPHRVNVSIDGTYKFSLDVYQLVDMGIKVGQEFTEEQLDDLLHESEYGKLYARALEYTMLRPHSEREVSDYLSRKMRTTRDQHGNERHGVSQKSADRVLTRLKEKGYINDESFARYWVDNRSQAKGISRRKLQLELRQKGVDQSTVESALSQSERSDEDELLKVIAKRRHRYDDEQKFIAYLARQGYSYDVIRRGLDQA